MKQIAPIHTLEIRHLLDVLQENGIDIAGADPDVLPFVRALKRGDELAADDIQTHLDRWLRSAGDRAWGLDAGNRVTVNDMGAFGHAYLSSRNLRAAIKMVVTYRSVLRTMHEVSYRIDKSVFQYTMDNLLARGRTARFFSECWLSALFKSVKMVLSEDIRFSSVSLAYPKPRSAHLYEKWFDCPVNFGQEKTFFLIPEQVIDRPFSLSNEDVRLFCEKQCQLMMDHMSSGSRTVDRARELMLKNPGWFPSCEELAQTLNVSSRTLRRRLNGEGSSYREILESVRRELAQNYLRSTDMTVESIAYRLGYEEPNSFYKAFKRWHGSSPKAFAQQST